MSNYLIQSESLINIANAIRYKTGITGLISTLDMATLITNISGETLNFEIVGGTTQPENPVENTIWINTDVDIAGYYFSISEPENIIEGTVWIRVGDTNENEIDITNNITVYPMSVKQYINGIWISKSASSFSEGVWTEWIQSYPPTLNNNFPADASIVKNTSITCEVAIADPGKPDIYTYQWYKNGNPVEGAINYTYTFTPTEIGTTTIYCKVSNEVGTVTSRTATITATNLYLYNAGSEYGDITGGWVAKNAGASINKGITKNAKNISCTIAHYTGRDHEESIAITTKAINLTNYTKLHIVISNFYNRDSKGNSHSKHCSRCGVCASSPDSPSAYASVTGTGTYTIDVSALNGNYYVFFGCSSYWRGEGTNYTNVTSTSVMLE